MARKKIMVGDTELELPEIPKFVIFGIIGAILAGKIKQKLVQPRKLIAN